MGQPIASCKCTEEVCCANSRDVGSAAVMAYRVVDDDLPLHPSTKSQVAGSNPSHTQQHNEEPIKFIAGAGDVRTEYVVVFQKDGDTKLGLHIDDNLDVQTSAGISISAISRGLAAEWNGKAPEGERIVPGDEIIEVNGIQGDKKSMLASLSEQNLRLVLTGCSAQRCIYEGQWQDNVWHGDGVTMRPDASRYEGQFVNGMAHGQGQFLAQNGNKFEGQWERNFIHGFGKYTYANGSTYEGEWSQNEKAGKGKQNSADGCCYEGEFVRNVRHGFGIQWQKEMLNYEGQWREDKMDGDGKIVFADGRTLNGQWLDGQMSEHGKMLYPSGSAYEGGFLNYQKHGEGSFTWPDGRVYTGQWRNGKQDGTGTLTDAGGVCLGESTWRGGKRVDAAAAA